MSRDEMRLAVADLLCDLLDVQNVILTDTSTAEDFEGWDSITHVRLLIGIERKYGFQFATSDASSAKNVGELLDLIAMYTAR